MENEWNSVRLHQQRSNLNRHLTDRFIDIDFSKIQTTMNTSNGTTIQLPIPKLFSGESYPNSTLIIWFPRNVIAKVCHLEEETCAPLSFECWVHMQVFKCAASRRIQLWKEMLLL